MKVETDEQNLMVDDINIIYRPKPKNIYKLNLKENYQSNYATYKRGKNNHHKKYKKQDEKRNLNLKKNKLANSHNFDLISFEEIENDFKELKARTERIQIENELLKFLENSTKDSSFDFDDEKEKKNKKNKKVERPKKILYNYISSL